MYYKHEVYAMANEMKLLCNQVLSQFTMPNCPAYTCSCLLHLCPKGNVSKPHPRTVCSIYLVSIPLDKTFLEANLFALHKL